MLKSHNFASKCFPLPCLLDSKIFLHHYHYWTNNANDEIMDAMLMEWKILHNHGKWLGTNFYFVMLITPCHNVQQCQCFKEKGQENCNYWCSVKRYFQRSPWHDAVLIKNLIYCWCQILLVFSTHHNTTLNRNFLLV